MVVSHNRIGAMVPVKPEVAGCSQRLLFNPRLVRLVSRDVVDSGLLPLK